MPNISHDTIKRVLRILAALIRGDRLPPKPEIEDLWNDLEEESIGHSDTNN